MKRKPEQLAEKITPADIFNIQCMEKGTADPQQQIDAFWFIVKNLCGTYMPTVGESDRESCFLNGRRHVGLEIINCLQLDARVLARTLEEKKDG